MTTTIESRRLRFRHRGGRVGGLRAGQPADGLGPAPRAAARSRRPRPQHLDPHPDRLRQAVQRQPLQLDVPDRAGTGTERAASSSRAARCWAARVPSTASSTCAARRKTSTAGASAATPAGPSRTCCPISSDPRISSAAPAPITASAARSRCRTRPDGRALRRLHRGRPGDGPPLQSRLQRREPGRGRLLPDHLAQRAPLLDRGGLPSPGDAAAEPARDHRGARHARAVRGPHGRGVEFLPRRPAKQARAARSDPVGRRHQLAPAARAVRLGRGALSSRSTAFPSCATSPAVGENLQDHLQVRMVVPLQAAHHRQRHAYHRPLRPDRHGCCATLLRRQGRADRERRLRRRPSTGPTTGSPRPTSRSTSSPSAPTRWARRCTGTPASPPPICQLRPESVGEHPHHERPMPAKRRRPSASTTSPPTPTGQTNVDGLKKLRAICHAPAMRDYTAEELEPGLTVASDADLLGYCRHARQHHLPPRQHLQDGPRHATSVVTPDLKVRGAGRLRVVDGSIMPTARSRPIATPPS